MQGKNLSENSSGIYTLLMSAAAGLSLLFVLYYMPAEQQCSPSNLNSAIVATNLDGDISQQFTKVIYVGDQNCNKTTFGQIKYSHIVDGNVVVDPVYIKIQTISPVPLKADKDLQTEIANLKPLIPRLPFPKYMNYCEVTVTGDSQILGIPQSNSVMRGICSGAMIDVNNGDYAINSFNAITDDYTYFEYQNALSDAEPNSDDSTQEKISLLKIWNIPAQYQNFYTINTDPNEVLQSDLLQAKAQESFANQIAQDSLAVKRNLSKQN